MAGTTEETLSALLQFQEQESCGWASRHLPPVLQDGEYADTPPVPLPGPLPYVGEIVHPSQMCLQERRVVEGVVPSLGLQV